VTSNPPQRIVAQGFSPALKLRPRDWLVLGAAAVAMATALGLQMARDRTYPRERQETDRVLYVRSGEALKRMTLGFDGLAADLYWIRAIQHYGGDRISKPDQPRRYQLLYPLLDLTTTLDPYFNVAYRFGAIFLSEGFPGGPGRPDQAVALLRKGLSVVPTKWQYYHDIAFVYYWHLRDYHAAAEWFKRGADQPNAPNWLAPMAATMLTHGEDRPSARFLWQQIAKSEEAWLRRSAARALEQLQALDQIDQLNAIFKRFPPPEGEPYSWTWLVRRRVLNGAPVDPRGVPYEIDPESGTITVSEESPLYPMPEKSRRVQ